MQPSSLKQLIFAALLPLIGFLPFQFFLHRDFAHFQLNSPVVTISQKIPFSRERAVAALCAMACAGSGILLLAFRLDVFPPLAGAEHSWRRLAIFFAYVVVFFAMIYFTAPTNYFVW